jgi:hypothetical protein
MGSEDTVLFLASLQAENATIRARCEQAEATVAACKAALKRVQAGFPSRSVDGGWGGSGDPAYADQVNKAIEAAEAARGGEQNA